MRRCKIPETLHQTVLELAANGDSTRAIADRLGKEHNVVTNRSSVANLLKVLRAERAETAKAVVREKLGATLTTDLDRLERFAKKCAAKASRTKKNLEFVKLVDQLRKITETKLKYSGAGEADEGKTPAAVIYIPPESDD